MGCEGRNCDACGDMTWTSRGLFCPELLNSTHCKTVHASVREVLDLDASNEDVVRVPGRGLYDKVMLNS